MRRDLNILAAQAAPHGIGAPFEAFADEARRLADAAPGVELLVFPELHLFNPEGASLEADNAALRASAQPLDGPLDHALRGLAAELGLCLVPGTLCELGPNGEFYNTLPVYDAAGERLAVYRKIFPWRPKEPFDPGDRFVCFDLPGKGRIGLTICYDAWFPEVARQLAWMGAELVLNLVKTTTSDREQELVLARANAIFNQVFLLSVNCAAPVGEGRSLLIGPEGEIVASQDIAGPAELQAVIDLAEVEAVRRRGTCGENRMWLQFQPGDRRIDLPAYGGGIDPAHWTPPNLRDKENGR